MSWSYTEDEVRHWYARKLEEWDWGQVVCADDAIVAYLAAIGAHIDHLFVDPDHQRTGIGTVLLSAMLARRSARLRYTCPPRTSLLASTGGSASGGSRPGGTLRIGPSICCASSHRFTGHTRGAKRPQMVLLAAVP
jgi:GNAT superfamily N-acetyltransferase